MRRLLSFTIATICTILLCACSQSTDIGDVKKWDCTVTCAEESDNSYVITYSDEKIISNKGILSFQNRNDFDIVIHLFANGKEVQISEIAAGGGLVLYKVAKGTGYTVGCHADVTEGTEIKLMVYDGDETEVYSN